MLVILQTKKIWERNRSFNSRERVNIDPTPNADHLHSRRGRRPKQTDGKVNRDCCLSAVWENSIHAKINRKSCQRCANVDAKDGCKHVGSHGRVCTSARHGRKERLQSKRFTAIFQTLLLIEMWYK